MVLADHYTKVGPLTTTTSETVRFEPPERIHFRLVRGPVPHVVEQFELRESEEGTELEYTGELGADLWALGRWWGRRVAARWESAVRDSLAAVAAEAERPCRRGRLVYGASLTRDQTRSARSNRARSCRRLTRPCQSSIGVWHDPIAAPVRRERDVVATEALFGLSVGAVELLPVGERARLRRGPGPEPALPWTTAEVGERVLLGQSLDPSLDPHLSPERGLPVEDERRDRIETELGGLSRLVVRVEAQPELVDPTDEHHPDGRRAVERRRRQGGRLGVVQAGLARLPEPPLEHRDRVVTEALEPGVHGPNLLAGASDTLAVHGDHADDPDQDRGARPGVETPSRA